MNYRWFLTEKRSRSWAKLVARRALMQGNRRPKNGRRAGRWRMVQGSNLGSALALAAA